MTTHSSGPLLLSTVSLLRFFLYSALMRRPLSSCFCLISRYSEWCNSAFLRIISKSLSVCSCRIFCCRKFTTSLAFCCKSATTQLELSHGGHSTAHCTRIPQHYWPAANVSLEWIQQWSGENTDSWLLVDLSFIDKAFTDLYWILCHHCCLQQRKFNKQSK